MGERDRVRRREREATCRAETIVNTERFLFADRTLGPSITEFNFGVFYHFPERMAELLDDLEGVVLFRREAYESLECKSNSRPVPEFP